MARNVRAAVHTYPCPVTPVTVGNPSGAGKCSASSWTAHRSSREAASLLRPYRNNASTRFRAPGPAEEHLFVGGEVGYVAAQLLIAQHGPSLSCTGPV